MNRIKYVPRTAKARADNPRALLVVNLSGRASPQAADAAVAKRGWTPLRYLQPAQRRNWLKGYRAAVRQEPARA